MALTIVSPVNSFIQFSESSIIESCHFADIMLCLPVFADDDINFQFFVTGEAAEIDALCDLENNLVRVGLVNACDEDFAIEFVEKPERFRLSDTMMMYQWAHGLPGATFTMGIGRCFNIKVIVDDAEGCSNCLQRIGASCDTTVFDYGNDENFAGFNYCGSGAIGDESSDCRPTIIEFTNDLSRSIPYTTSLRDKYGDIPTVQVYIYDPFSGELIRTVVQVAIDGNPATQIDIDFGGVASGLIIIR